MLIQQQKQITEEINRLIKKQNKTIEEKQRLENLITRMNNILDYEE
jgi:hypothetical protein